MYDRRRFLYTGMLAGTALAAACRMPSRSSIDSAVADLAETVPPEDVAANERFWREVRQAHDLETELVNLNHGLSPAPRSVQATLMAQIKRVNEIPVLREHDDEAVARREESRAAAARVLGCTTEEVALVRSGTESLHMAQLGIDLEPGDEVLSTREDYWTTWAAWQQRSAREGIVYREIDLGGPYPPPDEIVSRFVQAFTDRTRVVLFCHVTWRTGHILPVREICAAARSRGIETIVDGAHALGHIPFRVDELGCDYYGTSGHKWLQAPLGTGLLYVRPQRIRDLWPPPGSWNDGYDSGDIRKFEVLGSRTPAFDIAIADAAHVLTQLRVERKAARLRYLTRRWALRLREYPRVRLVTDLEPGRSCGIGAFYVEGLESQRLAELLLERFGIFVGPPSEDAWSGPPLVRVAPNVFNSVDEIDMFVDAVEDILPA